MLRNAFNITLTLGLFKTFLPRTLQLLPKRCCGEKTLAASLTATFLHDLHAGKAELISSAGIQKSVSFNQLLTSHSG